MTVEVTSAASPTARGQATLTPQPTIVSATGEPTFVPSPAVRGVTVATDKTVYALGEAVIVLLRNDLSVPIYGLTGKAYCTILTVQRKEDDNWEDQAPCVAGGPPSYAEIPAGAQVTVEVLPRLSGDRALAAGVYRVLFRYRVETVSGAEASAESNSFAIGQAVP